LQDDELLRHFRSSSRGHPSGFQDDERSLHRFKAKEHQEWLEKQERLKKENKTEGLSSSDATDGGQQEAHEGGGDDDPEHATDEVQHDTERGGADDQSEDSNVKTDSSRKLSRVRRSARFRKAAGRNG
jgi:hypothetical protein